MAKFKIQKGLSDADMMKNFKDTENFEDTMLNMERDAKKPGAGAFSIQVKREGKNIVLETAPKKVKPEK